jgi:multiple sugar transport system ATP-binding protein
MSEVVLGLRPEDVCTEKDTAPSLDGIVDSVLPVGSDRFLRLKVEGSDVFVRVDKEARHQEGAEIRLGLVSERLHLFDKATGMSLAEDRAS